VPDAHQERSLRRASGTAKCRTSICGAPGLTAINVRGIRTELALLCPSRLTARPPDRCQHSPERITERVGGGPLRPHSIPKPSGFGRSPVRTANKHRHCVRRSPFCLALVGVQNNYSSAARRDSGGDRVTPHNGSARVIHSLCCPVGGRPASPRKSQTKSQRRPTSGDTQRRPATVTPGQVPTERHRATPSDTRNVTGGQGVAGSNPAAPTSNRYFSNILTPHKSQQKSQLVVQRPLHRPAPRARHGAPPRHVPRQQNRQAHQSRRQRSLSHPGSARRPRTTANRPAHPPAHPLTTGRTLTGIPQLHDAGKPGVLKPGLLTPPWTRRPPA